MENPGIHLGFALSDGGDGVYLFDGAATLVDGVGFGPQVRDLSVGRNGSAPLSFIAPHGYVVMTADGDSEAGADHLAFRLSADQEVLGLFDGQGTLLDQVLYFPQTADVSQGRRSSGEPGYEFFALPTPGTPHGQADVVGDVVITEVHYHPAELSISPLSEDDLEFIELHNPTTGPLDVSNWRLHEAVDVTFPAGTTIPAAGHIVVVPFDPLAEPHKAMAFRSLYQFSAQVLLVGGYDGQLGNRGDVVELSRPVASNLLIPGAHYESVDRLRYRDSAPWPEQADGGGFALTRGTLAGIGSSPSSWGAEIPSPGAGAFVAAWGDVNRDGSIDGDDIDSLHAAVREGAVDFVFDRDRNGSVASTDVAFLVESILHTRFGDANLDGTVDFADFLQLAGSFGAGDAPWAQCDFNGDRHVDFLDFLQLSHHFGFAAAP